MAWEEEQQLNLAATPGSAAHAATADRSDDVGKASKLPRWTRRDLLVLIEGKGIAENNARRGRVAGLTFGSGSGQVESKWASVSAYCERNGVNRGPVPCRKRWSNLMGDFKKIREWEGKARGEMESFWIMRNDLRKERKLPVFFDKEVYDVLDGGKIPNSDTTNEDVEAVFDSGWSVGIEDGNHDDANWSRRMEEVAVAVVAAAGAGKAVPSAIPISEQYNHPDPALRVKHGKGMTNEKRPPSDPHIGSARKKKRTEVDGDEEMSSLQYHLIDVLEQNGKMVVSKLEAQNRNFQKDREQRKDNNDNLVAVLNKLADAVGRIADKL